MIAGVDFLRNYQFGSMSRLVADEQAKIIEETRKNGPTVGEGFRLLAGAWKQGAALTADLAAERLVRSLRHFGLCLPPPPTPPSFSSPHNNAEFLRVCTKRALWNWTKEDRAEIEEEISTLCPDKYNVFQVVGEWAIALSFENRSKAGYYVPTFLTRSELLESGESFLSVGKRFAALDQPSGWWRETTNDREKILNALYGQEEPVGLTHAGKEVYKDIRALASKLSQGNEAYTNAFKDHVQLAERETAASATAGTPSCPALASRNVRPVVQADETSGRTARVASSAQSVYVPVYPVLRPSAPAQAARSSEDSALRDLRFLRSALKDALQFSADHEKNRILDLVKKDETSPIGYNPDNKGNYAPSASPKYLIARLGLLEFFRRGFKEGANTNFLPHFFPWGEVLSEGTSFHQVGQIFMDLQERDYKKLQQVILHPEQFGSLSSTLRKRLIELNEFAGAVCKNPDFLRTYANLQIDLIAQ